jgi:hypothetical protein
MRFQAHDVKIWVWSFLFSATEKEVKYLGLNTARHAAVSRTDPYAAAVSGGRCAGKL